MKKILIALLATVSIVVATSVSLPQAEAQPLAAFCCDAAGVRRCVLENPVPAGNSCFCFNQGYGVACY